jgi:hypothetical protein
MENYSYRIEAKTVQTERGEGWQHLIPSRLPARGHKKKYTVIGLKLKQYRQKEEKGGNI